MSGEKESMPEAKDGLTADPDRDSAAKLLEEAPLPGGDALLLMEGGCGKLAAQFASRYARVINQNILYRNHAVSRELLAGGPGSHAICVLGDIPRAGLDDVYAANAYDDIVFRLGRGTALVNAALCEAFHLLRKGGSLWVSGHSQEGIKSFAKRAEAHFGNMYLLRIKSSCRLLRFQKESDLPVDPVENPGYFDYQTLELEMPRLGKLAYATKPGIFSYRATDIGTALVAGYLPDCTGKAVLDLGCGSGVLSLAAAKLGAKSILATDANVVATHCAAKNFEMQGISGDVLCTNLTEGITTEFDIVFSNPPFHHGSETDFSFPGKILDAILPRLRVGGSVFLVANRFLDYMAQASTRFTKYEILAREQGYCVYHLVK